MFATPPISTKILKGAGGGRSAGTISAIAPYFRIKAAARSTFPPLNRLRRSASPPLRPTKYSARHPAIEPSVAIVAYKTIRSGCCTTMSTMSRSLTSGNERKDESRNAMMKSPGAPMLMAKASIHAVIRTIQG